MAAPPPHRIRVVCRLRPADDAAVEVRGASLIVPKNRSVRESRDELPAQGGLRFSVDAVYDQTASQVSVFEGEAAKLVDGVVDGVTGTLLAYGQTGAGKTFTVLGRGGTASGAKYDDRGLVPRCLERLFATAMRKRRSGRVWTCGCPSARCTTRPWWIWYGRHRRRGNRWACPSSRGTV